LATVWLFLYGINAYWLTALHHRKSTRTTSKLRSPILETQQRSMDQMALQLNLSPSLSGVGVASSLAEEVRSMGAGSGPNSAFNSGSNSGSIKGRSTEPTTDPTDYPVVTVQLPIFNERYVSERLLDAVCRLDYPRDRLYIQVLDDSTDDTQAILENAVQAYRRQGIWVDHIHRTNRAGFKAGALQAAMCQVQGNYIAIFDADFLPESDWLKRTISHFCRSNEKIAVVQTRWSHLNSEYSLLTKLQAAALDGHFAIEQQTRYQQGYFLNFNGTAGIWLRQAIEDAGGWQADTLAEDMDLSYRAQLRGWKVIYDNNIEAGAELPVAIAAFKLQQFRWAKGGIQCAKKLLGQVWWSRRGLMTKIQATFHLTGYVANPLMIFIILSSVPTLLLSTDHRLPQALQFINIWGWVMLAPTFAPPLLYLSAQVDLHPQVWWQRIGRILILPILWTGISVSNTRAVIAGLFNTGANFRRTPKFNIQKSGDRWQDKGYRIPLDLNAIIELGLCAYSAVALVICLQNRLFATAPFMLLYVLGFGYVGGLTLWQNWQQNQPN
jgi:cellulose synthase/poly-beta-1,6-N-acetylglucosamine synthase-like glycosyltransferase